MGNFTTLLLDRSHKCSVFMLFAIGQANVFLSYFKLLTSFFSYFTIMVGKSSYNFGYGIQPLNSLFDNMGSINLNRKVWQQRTEALRMLNFSFF